MAPDPGVIATVAKIFKRCVCPEDRWDSCPHQWVVRYRTTGGRSSRQREQSFGTILREAEDFALKVEHDKRAHVFVDPKAGRAVFRDAAGTTRSTATSCPLLSTAPALPSTAPTTKTGTSGAPANGAESVLTPCVPTYDLPGETATGSTITQIYEGTNQIQRVVMARQLLKGSYWAAGLRFLVIGLPRLSPTIAIRTFGP